MKQSRFGLGINPTWLYSGKGWKNSVQSRDWSCVKVLYCMLYPFAEDVSSKRGWRTSLSCSLQPVRGGGYNEPLLWRWSKQPRPPPSPPAAPHTLRGYRRRSFSESSFMSASSHQRAAERHSGRVSDTHTHTHTHTHTNSHSVQACVSTICRL